MAPSGIVDQTMHNERADSDTDTFSEIHYIHTCNYTWLRNETIELLDSLSYCMTFNCREQDKLNVYTRYASIIKYHTCTLCALTR